MEFASGGNTRIKLKREWKLGSQDSLAEIH